MAAVLPAGAKPQPVRRRQLVCLDQIWRFMDDPHSSRGAYAVSMVIMVLIFVSTTNFILESVAEIREGSEDVFFVIEAICIGVFSVEVGLRLLSTPSYCSFFKDAFNWIDILSVVPFYVELALPSLSGAGSFGVVRVVRLVRVARIIKVSRYSQSVRIFTAAMLASMRPLLMLILLVSLAVVVFSSAVHYAELTEDGCRAGGWTDVGGYVASLGLLTCDPSDPRWSQLDANGTFLFSEGGTRIVVPCACTNPNPFVSIPATFWWCVVTMTTVGFGDHVPVTLGGRLVAVVTMISGIIILALPITVIGSNFSRVLREIQQERMLGELNRIDRDGDGMVDEEELALMIQHMAAVAGDLPRDLIPDAKQILRQYDVDGSGALTPDEVAKLRSDMHELLGTSPPPASSQPEATGQADGVRKRGDGNGSGEEESDLAAEESSAGPGMMFGAMSVGGFTGDATTGGDATALVSGSASAAADKGAGAGSAAAATGLQKARLHWTNSRGIITEEDEGDEGGGEEQWGSKAWAPDGKDSSDARRAVSPVSAASSHQAKHHELLPTGTALGAGGTGAHGVDEAVMERLGPAALAVSARLDEIEDRVDDKLIAIIDLLRKMNAAVSSSTTADAVM